LSRRSIVGCGRRIDDLDGSSFPPTLQKVLKTMIYSRFTHTAVNGRKNVNLSQDDVMPTIADN